MSDKTTKEQAQQLINELNASQQSNTNNGTRLELRSEELSSGTYIPLGVRINNDSADYINNRSGVRILEHQLNRSDKSGGENN